MNILAKIKSYQLLVRNLLHNLQYKRKATVLLTELLEKRISGDNKYCSVDITRVFATNGNNNEMMESTVSDNKVGSGDSIDGSNGDDIPTVRCQGIGGCERDGRKESNSQVLSMHAGAADVNSLCYVVERNALFRHTRFTYTSAACDSKKSFSSSRSLPDHSRLQNVYFLRNEHELRNIKRPISTGDVRIVQEQHDQRVVTGLRQWVQTKIGEELERQNVTEANGLVFKIMNYNVLAQDLLTEHSYLYKRHTPAALLWERRWKNLYKEITEHDADIICLQEVQESHIVQYYSKIASLGYGFVFKKRTGLRTDGCAFYYRQSVFNLEDYITVEYCQPNVTLLDRDNIAIVAVLSPKDKPEEKFVVATTHLLYNPRRQDIRVAQTQVLLAEVERMSFKELNKEGQPVYYPVVITGDFNSEPHSAVVTLLLQGKLNYENLSRRSFSENVKIWKNGKELIPARLKITDTCQHWDVVQQRATGVKITREEQDTLVKLDNSDKEIEHSELYKHHNESFFSTGSISHQFKFQTAYEYRIGNDTEGTTYQDEWITVDYIFYSSNSDCGGKLKLLSRYSMPTTQQLRAVRTIPNLIFGSDHLSLVAKFKIEF